MARRQSRKAPTTVETLKHKDKRANIPTRELRGFVAEDESTPQAILYPRDPSLDPQLVWQGKDEQDRQDLAVPAVPVYIQEKIQPLAIIENVRAQAKQAEPVTQLSLFNDFNGIQFEELIDFYRHEQNWSNRMILGDSLLVMTSLAEKEGLKGKVQMIYLDPPYGIKFGSNWQVSTRKRDVKDGKAEDATRQPEQIKAFRDTWELGIHSYLSYLRDRLVVARELLTESGSVFVQIGDENVHLVRCLLDEVFGSENFVSQILYRRGGFQTGEQIANTFDYILWFAKSKEHMKCRPTYVPVNTHDWYQNADHWIEFPDGSRIPHDGMEQLSAEGELHSDRSCFSATGGESSGFTVALEGKKVGPLPGRGWSTSQAGVNRLLAANRLMLKGRRPRYKPYYNDFPFQRITNGWMDTVRGGFTGGSEDAKIYVVQTGTKTVERCLMMTTDPGDLVLDPTCVRKGTGVWIATLDGGNNPTLTLPLEGEEARTTGLHGENNPTLTLPLEGEGIKSPPVHGGTKGGLVPIETLRPGQYVLGHDGQPHRILRVIRKPYRGLMIGLRHAQSNETLWLTADHRVLAKLRPRTLGGRRDWSAIPSGHVERARKLRRELTPPEQRLWSALRGEQLGYKFRRQHPLGPYIADFYSRAAHLVVEVDGSTHFTDEGIGYDAERDAYMRSMGLDVLRFTSTDIQRNLEGVCLAITNQCHLRTEDVEGAQWVQAGALQPGDTVFFGPNEHAVPIEVIEEQAAEEEVYDLEIEGTHSFMTEVCLLHNCGSGTTAYVAEQWGRRWITIDTSRVAIALARTRLMSARYAYYILADSPEGLKREAESSGQLPPVPLPRTGNDIRKGFVYKRVPHITLKSIANNEEIDAIHAKLQEKLESIRAELNRLLKNSWEEWQIPREANDKWSEQARQLHAEWWQLRRKRQQEIDDCIARHTDRELLYDQPYEDRKCIRVTGPFTVESLSPHRVLSTDEDRPASEAEGQEQAAVGQFATMIVENLKKAGVQNTVKQERIKFDRLDPYAGTWLHATGEYTEANGTVRSVAVSIGPEHGTVGPEQVREAAKEAVQGIGFDLLIVCGFAFDPHVSEETTRYGKLTVLAVRMNPDLAMGDELLKKTGAGNLFMVFGEPDLQVEQQNGKCVVTLRGVDVYDPTTGEIRSNSTDDIACWFIDTNYNGESFFVRHAYFTGEGNPYDRLKRALRAEIDESAWSALYSTESYPFDPPATGKIAVKVINHYGDEVLKVYDCG